MNKDYEWKNHIDLSHEMFDYLKENHPMGDTSRAAAISRSLIHLAYYACFHTTLINNEKYKEKNQVGGYGTHEVNIRKMSKYKVPVLIDFDLFDLQADLLQLKTYRSEADYEAGTLIDFHYAKLVIELANEIFKNLTILGSLKP